MDIVEQMKLFMEPHSVTIIGATRRTGEGAFNLVENLITLGYKGDIYPVNPAATEILGFKCYSSVKEINRHIDLAIIPVFERAIVPRLVQECVESSIKAIIIQTQDFLDASDEEGKVMHREIADTARRGGARIMGPNTLGTANPFFNFTSSFALPPLERMPIGIICQSGTFYFSLPGRNLLGKGIDVGNACDINAADGLEYFAQDPNVKVVGVHIEGTTEPKRLFHIANEATRRKPVVMLKTGESKKAANAAQSHTGSMVGNYQVWNAAMTQCNIVKADDLTEFEDLVKAFSVLPPMRGRRLGIASVTGAHGVMAIDACEKYGLEPAKLSPKTIDNLRRISPPWLVVDNPFDMWPSLIISGLPFREAFRNTLLAFAAEKGIDAALLTIPSFSGVEVMELVQIIIDFIQAFGERPVICTYYGDQRTFKLREELEAKAKTIGFHYPVQAVKVLSKVVQYWEKAPSGAQ